MVAEEKNIQESAVERDYYIVLLLKRLEQSEYADMCVFKGGTSLSKCYPGSIERFSEDIDLTFLGMELSDNLCEKKLKKIEIVMTVDAKIEKNVEERSQRNKSVFVWFDDENKKIKLEIGSSVRPEPYSKKTFKSYIHEYLEKNNYLEDIDKYQLEYVTLNVLEVERTFIDKIMAIKRHAICGTIKNKVRHIYDVARLFKLDEIQSFLLKKEELRNIVIKTKETDSHYLLKRLLPNEYDPKGLYDFNSWKHLLNEDVRSLYESLHEKLLYTNEKQNFDEAISTLEKINNIFKTIEE